MVINSFRSKLLEMFPIPRKESWCEKLGFNLLHQNTCASDALNIDLVDWFNEEIRLDLEMNEEEEKRIFKGNIEMKKSVNIKKTRASTVWTLVIWWTWIGKQICSFYEAVHFMLLRWFHISNIDWAARKRYQTLFNLNKSFVTSMSIFNNCKNVYFNLLFFCIVFLLFSFLNLFCCVLIISPATPYFLLNTIHSSKTCLCINTVQSWRKLLSI